MNKDRIIIEMAEKMKDVKPSFTAFNRAVAEQAKSAGLTIHSLRRSNMANPTREHLADGMYSQEFPVRTDKPVRVYSTFSESIKRKVPSTLWPSLPENARAILLLPVRLTRLEKEELLAVLETKSSQPS